MPGVPNVTGANAGVNSSSLIELVPVQYNPDTAQLYAQGAPLTVGGTTLPPAIFAAVAPTFSVSSTPTVTFNTTAMASSQAFLSMTAGVPNTQYFNAMGVGFSQRGTTFPQTNVMQSYAYDTEVLGSSRFFVSFYHTGSALDIIRYGDGTQFSLWIDGQYIGLFASPQNSGTAQAGAANTITLAAGASAVNQQYVGYTVLITGGTGVGQTGLVTGYVGATKVATVSANWGTIPDATSTYVVVDDIHGYQVDASGSLRYVNLNFGTVATRKIEVLTTQWYGVNIGLNDTVWPGPPSNATRVVVVGDSFWEFTGGPFTRHPDLESAFGRDTAWQIWPDGEGGTGWCATYSTAGNQRLNFMDRIAPPNESWRFRILGATAGTFTLSVTFAGSTQTTSPLAFNASDTTVQAAIQALSNVPAGSVIVAGGHDAARGWIIILHGAGGATLSANTASVTGTFTPVLVNWPGVVAPRVPRDGNGNALPFLLVVPGSGNDNSGGFTGAQIQANATFAAQYIAANFPTAITIFTGVVACQTHGVNGVIDATDVSYNTGIKVGAGYLSKVNGTIPFVDTYAAGIGGNAWIFGGGNIGTPTNNKNDILVSLTASGHPTGEGYSFLSTRLMQNIKSILGAY